MCIVPNRFFAVVCAALLTALPAPGAAASDVATPASTAQDGGDPTSPANAGGGDDGSSGPAGNTVDLLAGPTVHDETQSDAGRPGAASRGKRQSVGPRRWLYILQTLELDMAQQAEVDAVVSAFREDMKRFTDEYGATQRDLRQRQSALREAEDDVDLRDMMALRKELERIEGLAPRPQTYQERIWAILSEPQRATLQERLDRAATAMDGQDRRPGGGGANGGEHPAAPGADAPAESMMMERAAEAQNGRPPSTGSGAGPRRMQGRFGRLGGGEESSLRGRVRFLLEHRATDGNGMDNADDSGRRPGRRLPGERMRRPDKGDEPTRPTE
jgi:hypothetical protein